jgi:hypothetical protein
MTVRNNGTDTGTLKTRMGFLIRDSAYHGMGSTAEGVVEGRRHSGRVEDANPQISRFPDVQLHIRGLRLAAHPGMTTKLRNAG